MCLVCHAYLLTRVGPSMMRNLSEIEKRLRDQLNHNTISIISNLEYEEEDIKEIEQLLKEELRFHELRSSLDGNSKYETAIISSFDKYPLTFALYLVWHGIVNYSENRFWKKPLEVLELPATMEKVLGSLFLKTLDTFSFRKFEIEETTRKFVTPILAHGKVPNVFLDDFFETFLLRLYKQTKISLESSTLVDDLMKHMRSDHFCNTKKEEIELELHELERQEKYLLIIAENNEILQDSFLYAQELSNHRNDVLEILRKGKPFAQGLLDYGELLENKSTLTKQIEAIKEKLCSALADFRALVLDDVLLFSRDLRLLSCSSGSSNTIRKTICLANARTQIHREPFRKNQERSNPMKRLVESHEINMKAILEIMREIDKLRKRYLMANGRASKNQLRILECQQLLGISQTKILLHRRALIQNLTEFGKGNADMGWEILVNQFELLEQLVKLGLEKDDVLSALSIMTTNTLNYSSLQNEISSIRRKREDLETTLRSYKADSYSIPPLRYLNQSTKYFLLLGGESADNFVYECLKLLKSLQNGTFDLKINTSILSRRIVEALKLWWEEKNMDLEGQDNHSVRQTTKSRKLISPKRYYLTSAKESGSSSHRNRTWIQTPFTSWNREAGTLSVTMPESYFIDKGQRSASLVVISDSWRNEINIDLRRKGGRIYTVDTTVEIYELNTSITIDLIIDGVTDTRWHADLISDSNPYIILDSEGQLVDRIVKGETHLLLIPSGSSLEHNGFNSVVSTYSNYDNLEAFEFHCTNGYRVELKRGSQLFNVATGEDFQPARLIGSVNQNISVNGERPFLGPTPPQVQLFTSNPEELRQLTIEVATENYRRSLDKEEILTQAVYSHCAEGGRSIISLEELIREYGRVTVTVSHSRGDIWQKSFWYIPSIESNFSEDFFLPNREMQNYSVEFKIESGYFLHFEEESFSTLSDTKTLEFQPSISHFDAALCSMNGARFNIRIDVPAVRWQFEGENTWRHKIEEVWYENLKKILVHIPETLNNRVEILLKETEQRFSLTTRNQVLYFDLLDFHDSLTSDTSVDVHTVVLSTLNLRNNEHVEIPLLEIRHKWRIENLNYNISTSSNEDKLRIEWTEKGLPKNRAISLWIKKGAEVTLIKKVSLDIQQNCACFSIDSGLLDRYPSFVAFSIEDDYFSLDDQRECFDPDLVFDLELIGNKRLAERMKARGLKIKSFVGGNYRLEEVRYSVNENEQFYIESIRDRPVKQESEVLFSANIFKYLGNKRIDFGNCYFCIDFSKMTITMLVDQPGGDGAMYCPICGRLFWDDIDEEHKVHHILVDDATVAFGNEGNV